MITTLHSCTLHPIYIAALAILTNLNENRCSISNVMTMGHEFVPENSSSAAVFTLTNTMIYLKVIQYLNIRLRQIY